MNHAKTFDAIDKLKEVEGELHRLKNLLEIASKANGAAPREWEGLSLHEIKSCWLGYPATGWPPERIMKFYKAAEQKLKEKNT